MLDFATALYFDRSFRFTGKVTQGVAVGALNSIGSVPWQYGLLYVISKGTTLTEATDAAIQRWRGSMAGAGFPNNHRAL